MDPLSTISQKNLLLLHFSYCYSYRTYNDMDPLSTICQ